MTPEQVSMAIRAGQYARWARVEDATAETAPARKAFMARFEREVDPTGTLPPTERARRAELAKKAHFTRMALASSQARAVRKRAVR